MDAMKALIPASFAISGAYLIGLPLQSHIRAVDIVARLFHSGLGGPMASPFPIAPYVHLFIPWIAGAILIGFAIYFSLKSYSQPGS